VTERGDLKMHFDVSDHDRSGQNSWIEFKTKDGVVLRMEKENGSLHDVLDIPWPEVIGKTSVEIGIKDNEFLDTKRKVSPES
jgi:hypothetical protein